MKMSNKDITEFYNNYRNKHITDYIIGNRRLVSAIKNLSERIPKPTRKIIDVGCGIGWSTYELAKRFPNANVIGLDLSPNLIKTAKKLFQSDNLSFQVQDISENFSEKDCDVIVLLDVYEHISQEQLPTFHSFLKNNLAENGRVILACPSIYHQNWLKNNKPEALQPIDENVSLKNLIFLAEYLDGELVYFEYRHIWRTHDYFHAVVQKNVSYEALGNNVFLSSRLIESYDERLKRVKIKLGKDFNSAPFERKKINLFKKVILKVLKKLHIK